LKFEFLGLTGESAGRINYQYYCTLQVFFAFYLGLGDTVASQLHHGIVASSNRPLDVVEAKLDRLAALSVIGHRDASDRRPVKTLPHGR